MPNAEKAYESEERKVSDFSEKRDRPRFALLMRSAKLVTQAGEFLCIIRDISASGVKVRLFHELPTQGALALENSIGDRFDAECVWQRDGEAGLRFHAAIDVMRFIAEAGPFPRRAVRLRLYHEALAVVRDGEFPIVLRDLSREGARIESAEHMSIGAKFRIVSSCLPELDATICWRRHPAYGVAFRQVMPLEELAQRSRLMQPPEPDQDLEPLPPRTLGSDGVKPD